MIQKKIDQFINKNIKTILLYNDRVGEVDECRDVFKGYLGNVEKRMFQKVNSNDKE